MRGWPGGNVLELFGRTEELSEPFIDCLIRFQIRQRIIHWFVNVSGKEHRERSP